MLGLDKRFRYNISRDHLDREVFKASRAFFELTYVFNWTNRTPTAMMLVPTRHRGEAYFTHCPGLNVAQRTQEIAGLKVLGQEEHGKS